MPPKRHSKRPGRQPRQSLLCEDELAAARRRLEEGESPDEDTLWKLLGLDPIGTKNGKKILVPSTHPLSFEGWLPSAGSYRMKGLWARESQALSTLGSNPTLSKRQDMTRPMGLRNLGSTCYINTVLQCLFAVEPLREAVCALEPEALADPVLSELRALFLEMQHGRQDSADPTPLVAALQLSHSVQQDGQEFLKLFLSLLERRLGGRQAATGEEKKGTDRSASDPYSPSLTPSALLPALFAGSAVYETRCNTCGRLSDSSARRETLYEVALPLSGAGSVGEALSRALQAEELSGANQYRCAFCDGLRDATRRYRLLDLPPLLCISLQRFVFDLHKMDRVKLSSRIAFDPELRMGVEGQPDVVYDLMAVMIHKGCSAKSGHYLLHVQPGAGAVEPPLPESAAWWRMDDAAVSPLPEGPWSPGDHGAAPRPAAAEEEVGEGAAPEKKRKARKLQAGPELKPGSTASSPGPLGQRSIPSNSAYLLVYRQRRARLPSARPSEVAWERMRADAARLEEESAAGEREFRRAREALLGGRAQRQKEVREMLELCGWRGEEEETKEDSAGNSTAAGQRASRARRARSGRTPSSSACAAPASRMDYCAVPSAWLTRWLNADVSEAVPPIPLEEHLCPHDRLSPTSVARCKLLPPAAWDRLLRAHGGGPRLALRDTCGVCLLAGLCLSSGRRDAQAALQERLAEAAAALEAGAGGMGGGGGGGEGGEGGGSDRGLGGGEERLEGGEGGGSDRGLGGGEGRLEGGEGGGSDRGLGGGEERLEGDRGLEGGERLHENSSNGARLVSRSWLTAWVKRGGKRVAHAASPGQGLACPHGSLAPDAEGRASRAVAVGGELAAFLEAQVETPAGVEASGGEAGNGGKQTQDHFSPRPAPPFSLHPPAAFYAGTPACPTCLEERRSAAHAAKSLAERHREESEALRSLLARPPALEVGSGADCALVPQEFLRRWRAYAGQNLRRPTALSPSKVLAPPDLLGALRDSLCRCGPGEVTGGDGMAVEGGYGVEGEACARAGVHLPCHPDLRLGHLPPALELRRGKICVVAERQGPVAGEWERRDHFEIVSRGQWETLASFYLDAHCPEVLRRGFAIVATVEEEEPATHEEAKGPEAGAATMAGATATDGATTMDGAATNYGAATKDGAATNYGAATKDGAATNYGAATKDGATTTDVAPAPLESPKQAPSAILDVSNTLKTEEGEGSSPALPIPSQAKPTKPLKPGRPGRPRSRPSESARVALRCGPPVCAAAVERARLEARARDLTYDNAELVVELALSAEGGGPLESVASAAGARASKRARRGRATLCVSSSDTLRSLRLRLLETLGVHPHSARLLHRGRILDHEDETSLEDCEVVPACGLRVIDMRTHDQDDVAGLFDDQVKGPEKDAGFSGTLLVD